MISTRQDSSEKQFKGSDCMLNALLIPPFSLIFISMTLFTPPTLKFVIFSKNFRSLGSVDASHYNLMMDI